MPPIPTPVTKRVANSALTLVACEARYMPDAMTTRQPRMIGRRPRLSAMLPRTTEPAAIPMSSIASTIPRAPREIPHSAAMPGAAKLIASTSKPSMALSATHKTTAAICRRVIGTSSRIRCASIVPVIEMGAQQSALRHGYDKMRPVQNQPTAQVGPSQSVTV